MITQLAADRDEYYRFIDALLTAKRVPTYSLNGLCRSKVACRSKRWRTAQETLAFGPMRAVGLEPRSGIRPYAVVQLRQENQEGTLYNLVGFQTKMTYPEQRRVFAMIPGLEKAEFVRLGSLHRNTFINSRSICCPRCNGASAWICSSRADDRRRGLH